MPQIEQSGTSAAVIDSLNMRRQSQTSELPLPPINDQRRIAGILGALDDKIELNRRTERDARGNCTNAVHVLAS